VGFFGWAGVVLAATVGAIGTVDFLRRHPVALAVLVFPLLVTAAAVGVLGVGVHARYFLLALPVGYLVGTHGLVVAARSVLQRGMRLAEARAVRVEGALAVLLVILACTPLIRYDAVPKQDYLGVLRQIRVLAASEDRAVAAD